MLLLSFSRCSFMSVTVPFLHYFSTLDMINNNQKKAINPCAHIQAEKHLRQRYGILSSHKTSNQSVKLGTNSNTSSKASQFKKKDLLSKTS